MITSEDFNSEISMLSTYYTNYMATGSTEWLNKFFNVIKMCDSAGWKVDLSDPFDPVITFR